jgi:hypothetical protein
MESIKQAIWEKIMSAKIAQALHQIMTEVGYVQKTGKNSFHGYKYAGEADLLEKLRPAMLNAGLLLIPSIKTVSPVDENGITTVQMEYTLVHKDGDVWPDKIGAAGAGGDKNKNGVGDKGLYKAITGANKYLLFKLFQIETGDDPEVDSENERTVAAPLAKPVAVPKPAASSASYVTDAKAIIARLTNEKALRNWWANEKPNRDKHQFDPEIGLGLELMMAYGDRRAQFQSEMMASG